VGNDIRTPSKGETPRATHSVKRDCALMSSTVPSRRRQVRLLGRAVPTNLLDSSLAGEKDSPKLL
jgi:hypothetical protein